METFNLTGLIVDLGFTALVASLVWNHYDKHKSHRSEKYRTFYPRFWAPSVDALMLWPFENLVPFIFLLFEPKTTVVLSSSISVFYYIYSIYFHGKYGGTFGKLKCKIKVVDAKDESPIGFKQAFLRDCIPLVLMCYLVFGLSRAGDIESMAESNYLLYIPAVFGIWFLAEILTMFSNSKRRALHDFIAGTVVIRSDLNENMTTANKAGIGILNPSAI